MFRMNIVVISSVGAVCMAIAVLFIRLKAAEKPTSVKKILLPPMFMTSGAIMYFLPQFRITPMEILEAVLVGMFFSIFLIKTSKFEIQGNDIYLKRSKAFVLILIGLVVIRIALKSFLSTSIDLPQLGGMFFLLAYSMIIPWRIAMYVDYKKLYNQLNTIRA